MDAIKLIFWIRSFIPTNLRPGYVKLTSIKELVMSLGTSPPGSWRRYSFNRLATECTSGDRSGVCDSWVNCEIRHLGPAPSIIERNVSTVRELPLTRKIPSHLRASQFSRKWNTSNTTSGISVPSRVMTSFRETPKVAQKLRLSGFVRHVFLA